MLLYVNSAFILKSEPRDHLPNPSSQVISRWSCGSICQPLVAALSPNGRLIYFCPTLVAALSPNGRLIYFWPTPRRSFINQMVT